MSPVLRNCLSSSLFFLTSQALLVAQEQSVLKAVPVDDAPKKELTASWKTDKEARAITLSIPAPRGQIVDRNGIPLAQNRVVKYFAVAYPFLGAKATDREIIQYGRSRIQQVNTLLGKTWELSDEKLLSHYKNRRWLPIIFSISDGINQEITPEQEAKSKYLLAQGSGLVLQSAYIRYYPKGATAPHIIGHTGKVRPLPVTPLQDGDPLFEEYEGRDGLEKSFDKDLIGKAGAVSVLFNADGSKADEQVLRRPVPGNNVVTTLDYNFQKYTEKALAKHTKSGAMVIMDIKSGDILSMASYPLYDPNLYVPGISSADFKALNENKRLPLFARAFRGEYPPASTFKMIVALGALETGSITPKSAFACNPGMRIGDRVFHNHTRNAEGHLNVVSAIKRSCNTWFYQVGLKIGAQPIYDMSTRLGFAERTGIPIAAEAVGFVPSDSWMMQKYGHKMQGGDIANLSIGQGRVLVTPLQAAQAMAAIADGQNLTQARLIKQIQDPNDAILHEFPPSVKRQINLDPKAREAVVKGMVAVVHGSGGTGRSAALNPKYDCQIAGKTGTAQWNNQRNLAWFTGFLPANDPVYAYAVVYEGQPGESVSGGREAAPIVREVFNDIFQNAPADDPLLTANEEENKTDNKVKLTSEDEATDSDSEPKMAKSDKKSDTPEASEAEEETEKGTGVGGFFRRLFKRNG